MIAIGMKDKRIALDAPGPPVSTPDGDYVPGWVALTPGEVYARIEPVTQADAERLAGGTMLSTRTHLVTIDYHPQVTTDTRITYVDFHAGTTRTFQITAVQNPDEAYRELRITADETT
jgi:head-tail adaptor